MKKEILVPIVITALSIVVIREFLISQKDKELPIQTSEDFEPGTCLVRTAAIPDNKDLEEFETKGVVRPEIRIEGVGIKRYLVRFLSGNYLVTDPQSFTEKDYINDTYTEAPCPEKFKNVPLGVKNQE